MKYAESVEDIIKAVADHYEIPAELICQPENRAPAIVQARHVAQYIACKFTFKTKRHIADCFHNRDHTGVLYGFSKVSRMLAAQDEPISRSVGVVTKALKLEA